ncbi:GntR family transcriptional regulator, partial [Pseudomonas aeruginosa]
LEKRLAPAAKLSKETLGQIFRVSNGTIQRALTRLAEDGAVVMPPKEVASVARPDERQALFQDCRVDAFVDEMAGGAQRGALLGT